MRWTRKRFESERRIILLALEADFGKSGLKRSEACLAEIGNLGDNSDSTSLMRRYIYIMTVLVQHQRSGGLAPSQVERLLSLGLSILKSRDIEPETSDMAFLYSDLHLIHSQIKLSAGKPWEAFWEQLLAKRYARNDMKSETGFHQVASAYRAMRLGMITRAIDLFIEAGEIGLDEQSLINANLALIKCYRLSRQFSLAEDLSENILRMSAISEGAKREVEWERKLNNATNLGDVLPLLESFGKNNNLHKATFMVEAWLWSRAIQSRGLFDRTKKMRAMARKTELEPRSLGFFLDSALLLESAYDSKVPLSIRLRNTKKIMSDRHLLLTIDKELLILAALARWLARNSAQEFAVYVLAEYEALCLKATDGLYKDVFGIVEDLIEKDWYRGAQGNHAQGVVLKQRQSA